MEVLKVSSFSVVIALLLSLLCFTTTGAYDVHDPTGNITIKWDIKSWTADGYTAVITIFNFQKYRHIEAPGWKLGWSWAKKEVIWNAAGGQATNQGDCSRFRGNIPHCCEKEPTIVDLLPDTPFGQQTANCCKGGVISSWIQDQEKAVSGFQLTVGQAGTSNKTVRLPKNFTLKAPGPGYTCGPAINGKPSKFLSSDGRRVTQAMMTWNVTCTYSQFVAQRTQTCCVSLSSFYNDTIVTCPTCSCGCKNNITQPGTCVDPDSPYFDSALVSSRKKSYTPLVRCTDHMCPIRVHWHIKQNYREYWRIKITIQNFNYRMNYSQWNLVAQHPNFEKITQIFSFNYKPLLPYGSINDTAMFWGIKFYNDMLMQGGPLGNVQSEILLKKDKSMFTFDKGWAFPRTIYFNGDNCVMPPPDAYPYLPNASACKVVNLLHILTTVLASLLLLSAHNTL